MSNLSPEYRLRCLELATQIVGPRESLEDRTEKFCDFLGSDDPLRLDCLKLAVKTDGPIARASAERITERAAAYYDAIHPRAVKPAPKPETLLRKKGKMSS